MTFTVLRNTEETDLGTRNSINIDCESLPSYTIASGLPTYEEAIQMDKKVEKPDSLMKQDSSISLQMGMIQSVSKSSLLNYLNTFVQEKTWAPAWRHAAAVWYLSKMTREAQSRTWTVLLMFFKGDLRFPYLPSFCLCLFFPFFFCLLIA